MKKVALIVLLVIGSSIWTISAIADESYMLYCHKESGECFSPKKEADTTLEYFGDRNYGDYETVFINVRPARNIDKKFIDVRLGFCISG